MGKEDALIDCYIIPFTIILFIDTFLSAYVQNHQLRRLDTFHESHQNEVDRARKRGLSTKFDNDSVATGLWR